MLTPEIHLIISFGENENFIELNIFSEIKTNSINHLTYFLYMSHSLLIRLPH